MNSRKLRKIIHTTEGSYEEYLATSSILFIADELREDVLNIWPKKKRYEIWSALKIGNKKLKIL